MARPRTFDEEEVRDQALELFWRRGFRATTTRDLEAELGLTQSSLYNVFGSKRELLDASLDRYEAAIDTELLALLEAGDDLEAVESFFVALGEWITRDGKRGCLLVKMMAEDGGQSEEIRRRTRRYRRRIRDALRDVLRRAATGGLEERELEARADVLIGLILGLNIAAHGGADREELDRLLTGVRYQLGSWHS